MPSLMRTGSIVFVQRLMWHLTFDPQACFSRHPDKYFWGREENRGLAVYENWAALFASQKAAAHSKKTSHPALSQ